MPPAAMGGNRAEVERMPARKGSRRCLAAIPSRQLTSYADGFDELGGRFEGGESASDGMYTPRGTAGVHAETPR